ncbi:hypothetical protein ACIBXA_11590 [Micromonospora echinaurantiaca]
MRRPEAERRLADRAEGRGDRTLPVLKSDLPFEAYDEAHIRRLRIAL